VTNKCCDKRSILRTHPAWPCLQVIKLISQVIADFANGEISQAASLFDTETVRHLYKMVCLHTNTHTLSKHSLFDTEMVRRLYKMVCLYTQTHTHTHTHIHTHAHSLFFSKHSQFDTEMVRQIYKSEACMHTHTQNIACLTRKW